MSYLGKQQTDYIYCPDCKCYVDLWKYNSIEDTGHSECNWRYVSQAELVECVDNCVADGCFVENE